MSCYDGALMRFGLPALAALALLSLASCSSGDDGESTTPSDLNAQEALERSIEAMKSAESYQMEIAIEGRPPTVVDFVAPQDYHWSTQTSEDSVSEVFIVGDSGYLRSCNPATNQCSNWRKEPRTSPTFSGILYSFLWPLVALEMTEPSERFDATPGDSGASLGVRGSVDVGAAVEEARLREQQEESSSNPVSTSRSSIDILMSPEDFLTRRVMISSPDDQGFDWDITFSNFNQVTIQPPIG